MKILPRWNPPHRSKLYQYLPTEGEVDPNAVEIGRVEDLAKVPWLGCWQDKPRFKRFYQSHFVADVWCLGVELEGEPGWVVGFLEGKLKGLPEEKAPAPPKLPWSR